VNVACIAFATVGEVVVVAGEAGLGCVVFAMCAVDIEG